ncbi:MAG: hypothetical protein DMD66_02955 [Gemmatimonadetes bacterium]|nr:MAG: hypothetical protein DMD66_02955 [Gemmatimonadota bacterium]
MRESSLLSLMERRRVLLDQASAAALEVLETCLGRVRQTEGLSVGARAHLLADLAGVADAIDVAVRT